MTDKKTEKPTEISDQDLEQANGGYSVWIGGSVQDQTHTIKKEYQVADTPTIAQGNPDELEGGHGHDYIDYKKG